MILIDQLELIEILNEQTALQFTGKINILDKLDLHFMGSVLILDGQVISCRYESANGLKAFNRLIIDQVKIRPIKFVLEPEIIEEHERDIHHPYSVLKSKSQQMLNEFESSINSKPPNNVKIILNPHFIAEGSPVTDLEFQIMCLLSDWNLVSDIYAKSPMVDHETTYALIGLRKKGALVIKGPKS